MSYPEGGYPGGGPYPQDPQFAAGQPYPYPPAPPAKSNTGKVVGIIAAILIPVVAVIAFIGVRLVRDTGTDPEVISAPESTSASYPSASDSPSTTPPSPTTSVHTPPPPPPPPADVWIAAGYNTDTGKVTWARSTVSSDDASNKVTQHCPACAQPAAWARNACVAVAVGANNGWASTWGTTAQEAESKAITSAQNNYGVGGPFNTWSKCAAE